MIDSAGGMRSEGVGAIPAADRPRMLQNPAKIRGTSLLEHRTGGSRRLAAVHDQGVSEAVRSKVDFFTGDACQIGEMAANGRLSSYDGVMQSVQIHQVLSTI